MNNSSDASTIYRSTTSAPYGGETADRVQHFDVAGSAVPVSSDVWFSTAPFRAVVTSDVKSTGPKDGETTKQN
jgi:hypothetical protein